MRGMMGLPDKMKFNHYLKEEYISRLSGNFSGKNVQGSLFCNPTGKEVRGIGAWDGDYIRFIVNFKTKKLYVWIATIVHFEVAEVLYDMRLIPDSHLSRSTWWETCFAGTGVTSGSRLEFKGCSDYLYDNTDLVDDAPWLKSDTKWVDKWFIVPLVKSIKIDLDLER